MEPAAIEARAVGKRFRQGKLDVEVLKGVDFRVVRGESHAILGASGAGKSTLMHLLGGLDHVSGGEIRVAGKDLGKLSEAELGRLRNRHLGFIYQFHHLLPEFSALDNIAMPLLIRRMAYREARATAAEWLRKIGLEQRSTHKPGELSGGERQRVALARALVSRPDCLLADEPTGNLDQHNATEALRMLRDVCSHHGAALLLVSHDEGVLAQFERVVRLDEINRAAAGAAGGER